MEGPLDDVVTLIIQDSELQCSREILIQNSDYFRAMFDGNYIESNKSVITLNEVDFGAVNIILKVLWDLEYPIPESNIVQVLHAAHMLQFLKIRELCLELIENMLSPRNCLKFWVHTESLGLKEIYSKAKLVALMEFGEVRHTSDFLELTLDEILNYLGDVNLQCRSEYMVFESAMQWYSKLEKKGDDVLFQLLKCANFTSMTVQEINEVGNHDVDILKCISSIKTSQNLSCFNKSTIELVNELFNSKERNFDGFPCVLVDSVELKENVDSTLLYLDKFKRKRKYNVLDTQKSNFLVLYVDINTNSFKKLFDIEAFNCESLAGFKVSGYKNFVYFYGGEYLLGKGNWNNNIHIYDVIKEQWKTVQLKYSRRHFESCICGKYLFIVGGTGSFRVIQENIFWYDLNQENWSAQVGLPCSGLQLKCCRFKNELFILDIKNKCGYTFDPTLGETAKWKRLEICSSQTELPVFSKNLQVFSYNGDLFIKNENLFTLKLENGKLNVTNEIILPGHFDDNASNMDSVLSNGVLYTLHKQTLEDNRRTTSIEVFNLESMGSSEVHKTKNDSIQFGSTAVIFNVFHPKLM